MNTGASIETVWTVVAIALAALLSCPLWALPAWSRELTGDDERHRQAEKRNVVMTIRAESRDNGSGDGHRGSYRAARCRGRVMACPPHDAASDDTVYGIQRSPVTCGWSTV
jgi:hypothetical protein